VTKNEIFESWNQGVKYYLAILLLGEDDSIDGPHYVPHPFKEAPGGGCPQSTPPSKRCSRSPALLEFSNINKKPAHISLTWPLNG
jgi:hypothetical protein